jgi:hypothetical protein
MKFPVFCLLAKGNLAISETEFAADSPLQGESPDRLYFGCCGQAAALFARAADDVGAPTVTKHLRRADYRFAFIARTLGRDMARGLRRI